MKNIVRGRVLLGLVLMPVLFGCATNPVRLAAPTEMTCIEVKEPLSYTEKYGLLNVPWTTRLERGPYWSEKVDEEGTFYRGPPGGVSIRMQNGSGTPGYGTISDGGLHVPDDPSKPVTVYRYLSPADVPVQVPPIDAGCSTITYTKDASTSKISVLPLVASGAVGGAVGGTIGRGVAQNGMSYGQSAGAGAVGGAIGGFIIASIINAEAGKIVAGMPIRDSHFVERLRALAANKQVIQIAAPASDSGGAQQAAPAIGVPVK